MACAIAWSINTILNSLRRCTRSSRRQPRSAHSNGLVPCNDGCKRISGAFGAPAAGRALTIVCGRANHAAQDACAGETAAESLVASGRSWRLSALAVCSLPAPKLRTGQRRRRQATRGDLDRYDKSPDWLSRDGFCAENVLNIPSRFEDGNKLVRVGGIRWSKPTGSRQKLRGVLM